MSETYLADGTKERTSTDINELIREAIIRVGIELNRITIKQLENDGMNNILKCAELIDKSYTWYIKDRKKKFIALDCGGSGAFLIEKTTGEIFNIKGYGTPDYNKKLKANIGNIMTVDPAYLLSKRWNYLR